MRVSRATAIALVIAATFTDIVAYSVAVPVLPDLGRRLGASPAVIGVLFGSFGVTLLTFSIPMGAASDRIGRKGPMVGGMAALAAATLLFAFARTLPWLFAARLVQGAADAITWVVGFALIADLYEARERGRITGLVMMGTSFAYMIGPSLGGWLYEAGGIRLPFMFVTIMALLVTFGFLGMEPPVAHAEREAVPIGLVLRVPAVAACAIAVLGISSTISMMEPVFSMHLSTLGIRPSRIGAVYGVAAICSTLLNPLFGRLADRWGARRLTVAGLVLAACWFPVLGRAWSFRSAAGLFVLQASATALVVTPSLAYMAEATSSAGMESFGVAYGLYNMVWGAGLLGGPAAGGVLFERFGFARLTFIWMPVLLAGAFALTNLNRLPFSRSGSTPRLTPASPTGETSGQVQTP